MAKIVYIHTEIEKVNGTYWVDYVEEVKGKLVADFNQFATKTDAILWIAKNKPKG